MKSVILTLTFALLSSVGMAQDLSVSEFKDYVDEKTNGDLSQDQLSSIAKMVDKDSDGIISKEEFDKRTSAFRAVMTADAERKSAGIKKSEDDPKAVTTSDYETKPTVEIGPLTNSTDATVLLITAEELAESWLPFAKWKTQSGRLTKIVTVNQINRDFEADSIQEKIRLCVRHHIDNHKTNWVILGGDCLPNGKGLVPGGHTTVHRQERAGIPTDIVYLSPTNWDADGDGVYGEFKDDREAITYPDGSVGLGRIPVRTDKDIAAFTEKVIAYESSYPTSSFAKKMIYTCTDKPAYPKVRNSWDGYVSEGKLDGTTLTMTRYWSLGLGGGNTTGHALMKAKHGMAEDASDAAAYHLCVCELNLLGDPTLDMRAESPRKPQIQLLAETVDGKQQVIVKTDAPGSTVCISNQDEYLVVQADEQGTAKVFVESDTSKMTYTVSGPNLNSVTVQGFRK